LQRRSELNVGSSKVSDVAGDIKTSDQKNRTRRETEGWDTRGRKIP